MRLSLLSVLLVALTIASCTEDGDELVSDPQPVEAADAGSLPEADTLDGAADQPSATLDAELLPDARADLDASSLPLDAADAASLLRDGGELDGDLVDLADAALDAA